jgi:molecular chaperone DnaJ
VREGNDILLELPLNIAHAALGTELDIPTVDGAERLRIPPGTQTGATFRLRGKGVPFLRGNGRGDQIVVTRVMVPTRLTEQQRRLFQELERSLETEQIGGQQDAGFFGRLRSALGL